MDHTTAPLDRLVAAVVDLGGPLTTIISHMTAFEASGRGAEARSALGGV